MSINPNSNRNYYRTMVRIGNEAGSGSLGWETETSFNLSGQTAISQLLNLSGFTTSLELSGTTP